MTATPPVDRAATSRLIATLEHAWAAIRTQHPEVPQVVIVVASAATPRQAAALGHLAAGRWQLTDRPSHRPEVLVPDTWSGSPPDRIRRSAQPVPAGRSR